MRMGSVVLVMLAVMLIAALPVWLAVLSAVGIVMPWVFFGLIGWAAFAAIRGPQRSRWNRHYWPPPVSHVSSASIPPMSTPPRPRRQTASDYLPRTINAYLALPEGTGDQFVTANGKTALQELKEQLDLLDGKLNEIAEDLQRQDLDRLLANRRFLEQRFGQMAEVGPGGIEPPTNRL